MNDPINPKHYKHLPVEAIDIIEAAIVNAPSNQLAYLQGQVLKYLLRCWSKKGVEDLRKAKWYLDRLVGSFDDLLAEASGANETPSEPPRLSKTHPPTGYRLLGDAKDEPRRPGDLYWSLAVKNWTVLAIFKVEFANQQNWAACRKIDRPPKTYRDPTQADLANGPIDCEYRDEEHQLWRRGLLVYILSGSMPFLCIDKELSGQWAQCRIEVTE